MTAGLEIAIEGRSAREVSRLLDCVDLGVLQERVLVKAFTNNAAPVHQHGADHRIGTDHSGATTRKLQSALHQKCVGVEHVGRLRSDIEPFEELRNHSEKHSQASLKSRR